MIINDSTYIDTSEIIHVEISRDIDVVMKIGKSRFLFLKYNYTYPHNIISVLLNITFKNKATRSIKFESFSKCKECFDDIMMVINV